MLSKRIVRKSMDAFMVSGVLWSFFFAATTGPVLAGLLIVLEMTNVEIGLVNSLTLLMLPCQIIGAWLQQRYWGRKEFWFVTGAIYYISYILLVVLLYFWNMLSHQAAVYFFFIVFGIGLISVNLGVPVWFSWVGDLVPPRESNRFWNRRGGLSQLSLVVSSIIVGLLIDYLDRGKISTYNWMIGAGTVFGILSMVMTIRAKDVNLPVKHKETSLWHKIRMVWHNANFRKLVYFFGLQSFAQWLIIPFTFIYLQRTLNLSMIVVQLLVALCGITSFFSTYAFQVIGSKFGRKPIVLFCTFIKGVEFIFWSLLLPGSPWYLIMIPFIIGGFVNIGLLTSTFSLITSNGRKQLRTLAIAIFFSITGLLGFVASSLSGVLYDAIDTLPIVEDNLLTPYNVIAAMGSLLLFASSLLFVRFKEKGAVPTVKVVKTLFSNNPFRALYHTHVLSNPLEEKHRIQALSKAKGNLMVSELVNDLYSPSNRIRESAVWNIGRKGNKADRILAEELLKVLDMPALGIQAQAARALGHLQFHKATRYLVKYLDCRDATLTQSCIFALGLIGDKAAVAELENILSHDRYRMFWPHAAEALGRIGNFRHSRDIFNAYLVEFNWILKKQILIALLRSLTKQKDKIYSLFEQEDKDSNTVIETIISSLKKKYKALDSKQVFVKAMEHVDNENYLAAYEEIIILILNSKASTLKEKGWTHSNITERMRTLFAANLQIKAEELLEENYKSVIFWLIIRLWAVLKYSSSSFDRYVYLTALQIIRFLFKLDEKA